MNWLLNFEIGEKLVSRSSTNCYQCRGNYICLPYIYICCIYTKLYRFSSPTPGSKVYWRGNQIWFPCFASDSASFELRSVTAVEPVVGISRLRWRKLREEENRLINQRIFANVPKSPSQIIGFRHVRKPARSRTEIRSAPLTMRRRPDEGRQGTLH